MEFRNFTYTKKKDGETKKYLVMKLDENDKHLGGLDLKELSEYEIEQVIEIQKQYETAIKPYIKSAYKCFLKENIQNDIAEHQVPLSDA